MFLLNNKPLALDVPFTCNQISYPANWLRLASPEERADIGITEVADPASWDDRFYWGVDNPKDLDQLKTQWSANVKDTTNSLLASSDWMIIRKYERKVAIPEATATYRSAVLAECTRLLDEITAAADVDALAAVVGAQGWPEVN